MSILVTLVSSITARSITQNQLLQVLLDDLCAEITREMGSFPTWYVCIAAICREVTFFAAGLVRGACVFIV